MEFSKMISKGALLSVALENGKANTMTVSWGCEGTLWGKRVCFVFVRPERYTFGFCESSEKLTLSFFDESKKQILGFCGTKSGADVDKFAACGLTYTLDNGFLIIDGATKTLRLKKLYAQDMEKGCFTDTECLKFYENGGLHRMYVCEIIP